MPYFICTIKQFTRNRKDNISVDVVWYYRPCEIPPSVYQLLLQDRHTEDGSNILDDPVVKSRELFISDAIDVYPASALRGHASCVPFSEIKENVPDYISKENNWFYILRYNPESRRMANANGEIRIGANHQAIPPLAIDRESEEALEDLNSTNKEDLLWKPSITKSKLMVYLRAARSITSYNGYCETGEGCPDEAVKALNKDNNTAHSYNVLHKNDYDISAALQELIRNPTPKRDMKPWTDDERKRFMKGLRSYGKTFHKIRKECLPERQTFELVSYYYTWKKTAIAMNSRPHKRGGGRRNNVLSRKTRNTKAKASEASEFLDLSSVSENDTVDDTDSDTARDFSLYACRHCYTTKSRNWHHGGKDKLLLCVGCRLYYKRYGVMKPILESDKREPPPFIFKAAFENLDDSIYYSGRMRTRRSATPVFTNANSLRSRLLQEAGVRAQLSERGKVCNRKQITQITNADSDKEDKEDIEVSVTNKRKEDDKTDKSLESKKQRESEAEDADDESEEDSETGSRTDIINNQSGEESLKDDVTDTGSLCSTVNPMMTSLPNVSSSAIGGEHEMIKEEELDSSNLERAFIPVKQEIEEDIEETEEDPDVPDNDALNRKIRDRFKYIGADPANTCARCDMLMIYRKQKKTRPTDLDTSRCREEYLHRKHVAGKRMGTGTPPSTHQPAQITSHYETMRLFAAQAARNTEPQPRYWPGAYAHGVQHEIPGHRTVSPREYMGEPSGKFSHLLDALDTRSGVDPRSPRSAATHGHGAHGSHGYPGRQVEGNPRDFRHNPTPHGHIPHHPPVTLDNISRIPPSGGIDSGIDRGGGPPLERQTIDPITGLPSMQPHLHSHHHTHTHLHVHPDDLKYNRHHPPPPPPHSEAAAHFDRHERGPTPHHAPHPPTLPAPNHRPESRNREYHEHLLKKYPDLIAQMHHDPHLRDSLQRHGVPDARRDSLLHTPRGEGAASPSIPRDIPNAPSDPVAYHLWVTQYANMQRWKSHNNGQPPPPPHAQAPELSPHGMPQPPRLPHDVIRNERHHEVNVHHEKHMKEKLLYAQAEREQLARVEHFRTLEHEKHLRSMLQSRDHMDAVVARKPEHPMPGEHHAYKPPPGDMRMPYHSSSPFMDTLRRGAHEPRLPHPHERTFHDPLRFGHDRHERDRPPVHSDRPPVHGDRAPPHGGDRYTDRGRHERPSIFGSYKPPETIDLSEDN